MAFDDHANLAYSTVAVAPTPALSGTSLTVAAGQGALFPTAPFNVTVWPTGVFPLASNAEIVRVTAVVGDVLTIVRTQEGTSARAITVGDQIANTITDKVITDIEAAITAGGLTNIKVSAGTLSAERSDLTFENSNGVSFGLDTDGVITGTVRTNYAGSNGAITGGSITVNTSGVSVNLPAYLTTAMASNRGSDFVQATAAFHGTNASGTIASNAISVSVAAQTVQTQNVHNVTLDGNTAGALAHVSSGTLTLAGGNNITLSQNGNAVTISGANVGGAQTGISGIVASDATYTSGTVTFTGVGGGVTVRSNTGQRVDISVAAQTVQTQNLVAVSLSGNTAGVLALVSSGTVILAGGNNITVSQDGQSITISGPNAGGAQTGISGIVVSDVTYTSGTVSFSGQNNITIGSSVDGATQYIRLSVGNYLTTAMASNRGSDFVQATANFHGTNATGTIASDAISVSVAAQSVQTQSLIAGVYDGANSISTGTIRFTNANGVSFSINGQTLSGSVATTYLASNASTNYVQANAVFHGTNATGTIASNAISVSVAAPIPIATTVASVASANSVGTVTRYAPEDHKHAGIGGVGISTSGNTAGTTGSVLGTYWFEGGNSITVSQITSNNGSHTLRLSVGNYLTTAMASNRGSDFVQATAVFNGTNASGTIASGAISVSVATPIPIATAVKAVASVGSTGTITRYAPEDHQHAGVAAFAVTNTGNTLGNTRSQVGTFYLAASGAITASQSTGAAGNDTVWLSVAAQTNQTLGLYAVSNTTGESSSSTFDARTLSFHGAGIASVGYSNGSVVVSVPAGGGGLSNIRVSAGTTSNLLSAITFADSNGVSFGIDASTITATVSTYNTVGTATTVTPVASANSVGTVTRWAAEDHRHAGVAGIGISSEGNTAGTTGSQVGTYWLRATNNVTLSQITSNNGSHTLVVSGPPLGTMSHWPYPLPVSTAVSTYYSGSTSQGGGGNSTQSGYTFSLYAVPLDLPAAVAFSELRIGFSNTRSGASTGSVTHLCSIGFYTNNASTLSLVKAYYGGMMFSQNSITAHTFRIFTFSTGGATAGGNGGFAGLATSTIYSSQGNISANSQLDNTNAPVKFLRIDDGVATTLPPNQYYCVLGFASVSSQGNIYSCVGILQSNAISSINVPDLGRENSTQTSNYLPAWGAISTTFTSVSNAAGFFPLPNAIAISNMSLSSSAWHRFHFPVMRNHS